MPTAPTLDDVRAYLGTNAPEYTDEQLAPALAAEIAAQARAVRLPADPTGITTFVVGAVNTVDGSYWNDDAYVQFVTVTATATRNVASNDLIFTLDGAPESADLGGSVWNSYDVPGVTEVDPSGVPLGFLLNGSSIGEINVVAGQQYVISLECYQNATDHSGQIADFGAILSLFSSYPADLLEALLRRVQRLLEMRSKPLGYQDTATDFGVSSTRVGPDPEIRRLEAPYRKLVSG